MKHLIRFEEINEKNKPQDVDTIVVYNLEDETLDYYYDDVLLQQWDEEGKIGIDDDNNLWAIKDQEIKDYLDGELGWWCVPKEEDEGFEDVDKVVFEKKFERYELNK